MPAPRAGRAARTAATFSASGMRGRTTARMIRSMASVPTPSSRSRPTRASPGRSCWLDRVAGRPARPTGGPHPRRPLAARRHRRGGPRGGPHPGRRPRRLADRPRSIRPTGRRRAAARRPGPGRACAGPAGSATGRRSSDLRRHRRAVRIAGPGGAPGLRPRVGRILDGGFPPGSEGGRSRTRSCRRPPAAFTPRAQPGCASRRSDVRGAARRRRGGADRCARAGRVPRVRGQHAAARAHPGRGQRAGRGDDAAGSQHSATAASCGTCCPRERVAGKRMVCYDGSGVAAAKLAFVLTLLGHDDVAVYDGGWAEWGNRLDLPVDRLGRHRGETIERRLALATSRSVDRRRLQADDDRRGERARRRCRRAVVETPPGIADLACGAGSVARSWFTASSSAARAPRRACRTSRSRR